MSNLKVNKGNHLPGIGDGRFKVYSKQFNALVDSIGGTGTGLYDTINEYTTGAGCTVDGTLLKDGHVYLSDDSVNEGRLYFDTDNDTYLTASNDNNLSFYSNGNYTFLANAGGISMQGGADLDLNNNTAAEGQLIFDIDGDSYMTASADDVVDLYVGAFKTVTFTPLAMEFAEGSRIVTGTTSGSQIGTTTAQKLSFWGATPIVQPAGLTANDAQAIDATYGVPEQEVLGNVRTRLLELETRLKDAGLLA